MYQPLSVLIMIFKRLAVVFILIFTSLIASFTSPTDPPY